MLKKLNICTLGLFQLIMLLFFDLGCGFDPARLFPEQTIERWPPAIVGRTISQEYRESLAWHRDNIHIRNILAPSPGIIAGYEYVAFVNFTGGPLSIINQLELLDASTGTTLWQSERFPDHEAVAISEGKAFILLNEGSPLNIYNIGGSDGKPINSLNSFNAHTQFYLFPTVAERNIHVYYNWRSEYSLHKIDLTGKEVAERRKIKVPHSLSLLFLFDRPFMLSTGGRKYTWTNFETKEDLWHIPSLGRIDSWPVLRDTTLIISADSIRRTLIAIDIENGHELWRTEGVFGSNVVLHQGSLYTLRNDAVLVKLTLTTGQIEEEIPFNPASINAGSWAYWLASDGDRLFVYFGDSQELFALKL